MTVFFHARVIDEVSKILIENKAIFYADDVPIRTCNDKFGVSSTDEIVQHQIYFRYLR